MTLRSPSESGGNNQQGYSKVPANLEHAENAYIRPAAPPMATVVCELHVGLLFWKLPWSFPPLVDLEMLKCSGVHIISECWLRASSRRAAA